MKNKTRLSLIGNYYNYTQSEKGREGEFINVQKKTKNDQGMMIYTNSDQEEEKEWPNTSIPDMMTIYTTIFGKEISQKIGNFMSCIENRQSKKEIYSAITDINLAIHKIITSQLNNKIFSIELQQYIKKSFQESISKIIKLIDEHNKAKLPQRSGSINTLPQIDDTKRVIKKQIRTISLPKKTNQKLRSGSISKLPQIGTKVEKEKRKIHTVLPQKPSKMIQQIQKRVFEAEQQCLYTQGQYENIIERGRQQKEKINQIPPIKNNKIRRSKTLNRNETEILNPVQIFVSFLAEHFNINDQELWNNINNFFILGRNHQSANIKTLYNLDVKIISIMEGIMKSNDHIKLEQLLKTLKDTFNEWHEATLTKNPQANVDQYFKTKQLSKEQELYIKELKRKFMYNYNKSKQILSIPRENINKYLYKTNPNQQSKF